MFIFCNSFKQIKSIVVSKMPTFENLAKFGNFIRRIRGGRIITSKSGQDVTAVLVTWEQALWISQFENIPTGSISQLAFKLRVNGPLKDSSLKFCK